MSFSFLSSQLKRILSSLTHSRRKTHAWPENSSTRRKLHLLRREVQIPTSLEILRSKANFYSFVTGFLSSIQIQAYLSKLNQEWPKSDATRFANNTQTETETRKSVRIWRLPCSTFQCWISLLWFLLIRSFDLRLTLFLLLVSDACS